MHSWIKVSIDKGVPNQLNYFAVIDSVKSHNRTMSYYGSWFSTMTHWHSLYRRLKCYFVVCGLKCNFCISGRSWEDCANEVKIESCSSGKNRCGTLYGEKGSMKYYLKGCLSAKKCQSFELDSKGDLWNCNVICCKGDLCNGDHPQYHWPAQ